MTKNLTAADEHAALLDELDYTSRALHDALRKVEGAARDARLRLEAGQRVSDGMFSVLHTGPTDVERASAKLEALLTTASYLGISEADVRKAYRSARR